MASGELPPPRRTIEDMLVLRHEMLGEPPSVISKPNPGPESYLAAEPPLGEQPAPQDPISQDYRPNYSA